MTSWTRSALPVASALLVAGCIGAGGHGAEPPRPDRSIAPEVVSTLQDLRHGACATITVSLETGETIEVQTQTNLAGCSTNVTPVLLGNLNQSLAVVDGKQALVLTGTLDGAPWIGSAPWRPNVSAWCVIFGPNEGAYREGDTFHLASGLVVGVSSGFGWIDPVDESEFLPLRDGDELCLNDLGQAIRANVWNGM